MRFFLAFLFLLSAAPLRAGAPRIVADIAPVHGIVAEVMAGVAMPDLLLTPDMSPHHVTLRPSQARAMEQADLVVWMGPALTPWLEKALTSLRKQDGTVTLLTLPGTVVLPYRHASDDRHQPDDDDGHGHDHGHDGAADPHAWLDPRNAALWAEVIAERLSGIDPDHADRYRANARAFAMRLAALEREIAVQLAGSAPHVVYHDAFQYFENRFGLSFAGALAAGDVAGPGAAHLAALRDYVARHGITCAFHEPQLDPRLLKSAFDGLDIRIGMLDPLGRDLARGPGFYDALLRNLAAGFALCKPGT